MGKFNFEQADHFIYNQTSRVATNVEQWGVVKKNSAIREAMQAGGRLLKLEDRIARTTEKTFTQIHNLASFQKKELFDSRFIYACTI